MICNCIFDWSGTLVDDLPIVLEATNYALQQVGENGMSREVFRDKFRLPVQEFYDRAFPGLDQVRLQEAFHRKFAELQHRVSPLPHAGELLDFLVEQGVRLFLLTSVPESYLKTQLERTGWTGRFEGLWAGVSDKRQAIGDLLSSHGLQSKETLLVGDMEHDLDAARAGGVKCCAVLTGYQTLEDLRRAVPDLMVEHLGELQRLWRAGQVEMEGAKELRSSRPIATVGALIRRSDGRWLMLRTQKWSDRWGIPGGKIEYGETAEEALRREILEETNLCAVGLRFVMIQDCIESEEFYRRKHFLLLNYVCGCKEPVDVRLNHEAQAFEWVTSDVAQQLQLNRPTRVLLERVLAEGSAGKRGCDG